MQDLKAQRAVESDSSWHFVGAQCDCADPLDHGQLSRFISRMLSRVRAPRHFAASLSAKLRQRLSLSSHFSSLWKFPVGMFPTTSCHPLSWSDAPFGSWPQPSTVTCLSRWGGS